MTTYFFNRSGEILAKREGSLLSVDLSYESLIEIQLTSLVLEGARFHGSNMTRAEILNCDLYWSSFANADCGYARFVNCNLIGAIFRDANLTGATFDNCRFFNQDGKNGPDFEGANVTDCQMKDCDLTEPNGAFYLPE